MKLIDGYKTDENYVFIGLQAYFPIFDKYVAFMKMLTIKENITLSRLDVFR